ncbi:NADP-dependent oxidoreductase [Marinigracilibium pacificum]|uniref:NADP-dependent oxidoreductase n=1 Tax=Marinigracilibium pacificum TaxID=2729599 RepID=A0A848J0N1_9BACT|nr:NADP-dependent oxidoreductase [Marinigracilibium pacificum]NMM50117.1 NADP-dependent oxidoreductase [Marinigracilibium pacificum]
MQTRQITFAARPKGMPDDSTFKFETVETPELKDGEVLLRSTWFSVDPYMRGKMNDARSYTAPFEVDKPLEGGAIAVVEESKSENFNIGDTVFGMLKWAEHQVSDASVLRKIDPNMAPPSYYVGILGMPGLTAYFGLMKIGEPKEGDTVVVSGAAGAVGSIVGQIAKINGCRAVGIAGSDEKVAMLKEKFGFDAAINYKTSTDIKKDLREACPNGVDIYFDNVGGEISDAVTLLLNDFARVSLCGQIALYNVKEVPVGPRLESIYLTRRVKLQGFIVSDFQKQFGEGIKQIAEWLSEGKLKYEETVVEGFDNIPNAFLGLFFGDNKGKMVVKV